jgi:hypothetical protein
VNGTISKLDDHQRDFADYYPVSGSAGTKTKDKIVIYTGLTYRSDGEYFGLGLQNTGLTNGKLIIEGLVLIAQDYAPYDQDVTFTIRSATDDEIATWGLRANVVYDYYYN